ncbi:CdaR family protein [Romboutsia timonensis]|uniref:CdaR family protein n=1 Tax=Romboutsia timonensis TaxID=1776391 RepID=UPI0023F90BAB|nr:CdaR family protein [Romboutsia timonensis]
MKNKLKNNTKIKLISLLSAIVLWIYVMAIVDPEDTRLFENVPVVVTNIEELAENDLIVYPESDLVADINIKGKLSDVQKITVDDIHIYGTINNPMEGNNKLSLKVNITKQVSYEFKTDFIVVRLEKLLYDEKDIKPEIIGKYKDDVDTVSLSQDTVEISGPRILIDQVDHVKASIKVDDNSKNMLNQKVKLMAVNNVGKEVKGISLSVKNINAEIKLLEEKEVPINIQLKDNTVDISKYEIKPSMVTIRGKKDVLDNIDYINTKKLDIASIGPLTKVELEVPEGIAIKDNNISIKLKESESSLQRLIYDSNDVELKNNYDKIDASKLNIPDNINVEVELNDGESKIDKSDIKLYIDLSEGYEEGKKYNIKYATDKNVKSIIIIPSEVG